MMAISIPIAPNLTQGIYRERKSRFSALVDLEGVSTLCFLPNPGRLKELLTPGRKVLTARVEGRDRATGYDLVAVLYGGRRVSIDARIPNRLIRKALEAGALPEFSGLGRVKPESRYGESRLDFLLDGKERRCLLEVKSCTLLEGVRALFPDAPTERGARHLLELAGAVGEGYRAAVLFLVQRPDAECFSPNDPTDPEFGRALRTAASEGVEVYAYSSGLYGRRIQLLKRLKVELNP